MSVTAIPAVRREIRVDAPVEHAFEVFTARMRSWWPLDTHHIGEEPAVDAVLEPAPGGRWFERAADGSECDWGRVLAWEPPVRVVLAWHLNARWEFDPSPERATEVEVTFAPEGGGTLVTLEHRHLERLGDDAERVREAISSEGGWGSLLGAFRDAVAR